MKKILFFSVLCLAICSVFAQSAPQAIKYQAVIRDLSGNVVANNNTIRMKVNLIQSAESGPTVYSELHELKSNGFGLVNFEIGRGINASSNFADIDWSAGPYFVKMEVEINNSGFTNMGTMELVSVPYALFAETAGNGGGVSFDLSDYVVPIYDSINQKMIDSKIFQNKTNNDISINSNVGITGGKLSIDNYSFPTTAGTTGQILSLDATNTLTWKDGVNADSSWERNGEQIRNINPGSVIIGTPSLPQADIAAKLHVDNGDFVVKSADRSASPGNPPYDFFDYSFSNGIAGMMWWSEKQAFRVGRNDDFSGDFVDAWNGDNIGEYSIGMGTNVIAKAPGSFAIGRNIAVDNPGSASLANTFAIGMNNKVGVSNSGDYSFGIGAGNTVDAPSSNAIGQNNTIVDGENISVLGTDNTIQQTTNALIFGQENILNINAISDNEMTVLIGKANTINGYAAKDNILIGRENTSSRHSNIAIGQSNAPYLNSISIGYNNTDGPPGTNAAQNNIILGRDNDLDGSGKNAIVIGQRITKLNTAGADFAPESTISIGSDIHPHRVSGTAANRSINIGYSIETRMANSINIGQSLSSNGTTSNGISIGRDITNTKANSIVIGTNNESLYPNSSTPAFVVGRYGASITNHLIYCDISGNIYFGCTGGTSTAPDFHTSGSTVYARVGRFSSLYAGGAAVASDRKFKSNIQPLQSGMEDYLYRIRSFSYTMNADETQRLNWGFIAQDVQTYFPHLVYDLHGDLYLNYDGFIPVLWKIAQDQQTKIDEQQARIEELERQIENINYLLEELNKK